MATQEYLSPSEQTPAPEDVYLQCSPVLAWLHRNDARWYDVDLDPVQRPREFRQFLDDHDPRLTRRNGQRVIVPRQELNRDASTIASNQLPQDLVDEIARVNFTLGLHDPVVPMPQLISPLNIVLGGNGLATLARGMFAAQAMAERPNGPSTLLFAGSTRLLGPEELDKTGLPQGATESDACYAAAEKIRQEYPQLRIVVAATSNPGADSLAVIRTALAYHRGETGAEPKAVTYVGNPIYVPYIQQNGRMAADEHGIPDIYVAGAPSNDATIRKRSPETYLTEIIRACRAAHDRQLAQA